MPVAPTPAVSPAEDDAAPMLRPREVARLLSVSPSTVHKLMREGSLPTHRIGGSLRVHPVDLAAFVASSRSEDRSRPRASHA